jgi:hypothetical protein
MSSIIAYCHLKYLIYQLKPNKEIQYIPSKSDTSLFIKLSESKLDDKVQNGFDNYKLYDLFLQGLNVVVETRENLIELPVKLEENNESIERSQYGM